MNKDGQIVNFFFDLNMNKITHKHIKCVFCSPVVFTIHPYAYDIITVLKVIYWCRTTNVLSIYKYKCGKRIDCLVWVHFQIENYTTKHTTRAVSIYEHNLCECEIKAQIFFSLLRSFTLFSVKCSSREAFNTIV